jgi:hypothetical protein
VDVFTFFTIFYYQKLNIWNDFIALAYVGDKIDTPLQILIPLYFVNAPLVRLVNENNQVSEGVFINSYIGGV